MGERFEHHLAALRDEVLDGRAPTGAWTSFQVHDPKPRLIHAPAFRDRVLHHALLGCIGPHLDRGLVDDTFACRLGKGTLAAVRRAQQHVRRFAWYVQVDVRAYFASIRHDVLRAVLDRRLRDAGIRALCARILAHGPGGEAGVGLPIGALTSQYFANLYLDAFDRFLGEGLHVRGLVRYMDDVVWWCDDREAARATRDAAVGFLARERGLTLKPARIGRSAHGLSFLGFQVRPGALRLSRRRRRRYAAARSLAERAWRLGQLDALGLQAAVTAAQAITAHADARGWQREQLKRRPPVDA
ncbi:MAG: reverse transcriptase/maturase family protein [bacterium]